MILALDVGNTNIVIGAIEEGRILQYVRLRTEPNATTAEYAIKLAGVLDYMHLYERGFEGAILSTTVPQLIQALSEAVKGVTGCDVILVSNKLNLDLEIKLDDPSSVAGDLLVGAVAAREYYGWPVIQADLGTATTICVIDKDGAFAGGAIVPGVWLSLNALTAGAALLPEISLEAPEKAVSTNTVDCMRSGSVFGNAAMLDGMIDRFEEELGYRCKLIATGGLAPSIVKNCRHEIICDDDLLLKGLWAIYKKNC